MKTKVDGMQLEPNMDENRHAGLLRLGPMPVSSRCRPYFLLELTDDKFVAARRESDSARLGRLSNRLQLKYQLPLRIRGHLL